MERRRYDKIAAMVEKPNAYTQEELRKAVEELAVEAPAPIAEEAARMLNPSADPAVKRETDRRRAILEEANELMEASPLAAQSKLRELQKSLEADLTLHARGPAGFGYGEWVAQLRRLLAVVQPSAKPMARE